MKRIQTLFTVFCTAALLAVLPAALAGPEATPTDLGPLPAAETAPVRETEANEPADTESVPVPEETDPDLSETTDMPAAANDTALQEQTDPEETEKAGEPAAEAEQSFSEETDPETADEADAALSEETDREQELLDAGYVKVTIIREQGTNLYQGMDNRSDVAGVLAQDEEVWARPQGGFWAEVLKKDPQDKPAYFNLNNAALLRGEIPYALPMRKVTLKSTLDGMKEIKEGTEVTMTAKYSGFQEDEILGIRWQYRPANDADGVFRDIEGAEGFSYTYAVNEENIHHEWRIVLTMKP